MQSGNRAIGQGEGRADFKKMAVWQESQAFARDVIRLLPELPRTRAADVIANQLMRAAGSIPANVAEGYGRFSQAAYRNHLSIARGSAFECESWLDLLISSEMVTPERGAELLKTCSRVQQLVSARMMGLGEAKATYAVREDGPYYSTNEEDRDDS
jgi:four helix bundle protein